MSKTIWQGASVLLLDDGAPIFALKIKEKQCYLTGIGGKVETGESQRQCAIRETLEETGAKLSIIDSSRCFQVDFEGKSQIVESENGALARIHKAAQSPQGKPWDYSLSEQKLRVDIFLGKLKQSPQAIEKHPAFIAIDPQILADVLKNGLDIANTENSFHIVGGELPENLPPKAFIVDSLEALFIALGDDLEKFLEDAIKLSS